MLRERCKKLILHHLPIHLILENRSAHRDADRLTEIPEEGEKRDRVRHVRIRAGRLHAIAQSREEHPDAEAGGQVDEDPPWRAGRGVEQHHQARSERGERPAGPDGPAVLAEVGDEEAYDHGGGSNGECLREGADAGEDHRVAAHALVVQRQVVDYHPEHQPVGEDADVGYRCGAVLEDLWTDERLRGEEFDPKPKGYQTGRRDEQGYESAPGGPRVLDAAPCDGDEEACERGGEENDTDPVYAAELGKEGRCLEMEFEEEDYEGAGDTDDGQVDPRSTKSVTRFDRILKQECSSLDAK